MKSFTRTFGKFCSSFLTRSYLICCFTSNDNDDNNEKNCLHRIHRSKSNTMKSCALRNLRLLINFIRTEIVMFFCNFCELFLLIFILSYVIFQSVWILLFIGLGILGLIYNLQDLLVYHPQEPPESKFYIEPPSLYNLPYEVVQLKTSDGVTLHSYLMLQNQHMCMHVPTVVLFHGNAG